MAHRTLLFALLATVATALFHSSHFSMTSKAFPLSWFVPPSGASSESLFARGVPQPLACADAFDLQLIPGISEKIATRIIDRRASILKNAHSTNDPEALRQVFGIGESKARTFSRYLSFEARCDDAVASPRW